MSAENIVFIQLSTLTLSQIVTISAQHACQEEFALVCNLVPLQRVVKRYQILEQELRRTCHEYFFSTETSMLNLEKAHHHQIDENGMHNGLNDNMNTIINGLPPQPPTSSPRRNPGSSKEYIAPTSPFSPSSRKQSLSPSKQKYGIMSPDSLGANVIAAIIAPANHDGTGTSKMLSFFKI